MNVYLAPKRRLKDDTTIEQLGEALGKEVRTLNFRINSANISGIGNEPDIVGTICGLESGVLSDVLFGENGAFVVVTSPVQPAPVVDYNDLAKNTQNTLRSLVNVQAYKALESKANIDDQRHIMF